MSAYDVYMVNLIRLSTDLYATGGDDMVGKVPLDFLLMTVH